MGRNPLYTGPQVEKTLLQETGPSRGSMGMHCKTGNLERGLSPTAWRQVYTSSIRAIVTYGWELADTKEIPQAIE